MSALPLGLSKYVHLFIAKTPIHPHKHVCICGRETVALDRNFVITHTSDEAQASFRQKQEFHNLETYRRNPIYMLENLTSYKLCKFKLENYKMQTRRAKYKLTSALKQILKIWLCIKVITPLFQLSRKNY